MRSDSKAEIEKRGGWREGTTALENAVAIYDIRITIYDLLIMCALRRFFESSTYVGGVFKVVIMMPACCHDF